MVVLFLRSPNGLITQPLNSGFRMTTSHNVDGSYKWLVVGLLWPAYFLNHGDRQLIFSVFPLLERELGLSKTQLGLLGSSFQWVFAILVPISGLLGDRLSRKNLIVLAVLLWSACTFCSGLVSGFLLLLLLRAITGAGEALYYPSASSMISDYHGQRTRSLAMSLHQSSVYIGIVFSGALAGYIGEHYGWRHAFLTFGGTGILVAILLSKALREPRRGQADQADQADQGRAETAVAATSPDLGLRARITETLHSPTAVILMLAFLGMNFVNVAYLTWTPTLLYEKFHLSLAAAGFHSTFYHHFGALIGAVLGGKLADRWAVRARVSRPLIQVAGLLLGAPFIFLLGWSNSSRIVFASLGLFGVFRGLYDSNLFASLYEVVRPAARATATGIMIAVAFLAGGSAAILIGWFSQRIGIDRALTTGSWWYLGAGLLLLLDCLIWFSRDAARMRAKAFAPVARLVG